MAISQTWDASYEASPADNDQVSEGALRIRNLKRDIRQRMEIDHDWDDTTDAGKHLKVTFRDPLGAKPTAVADEGYLYTKDVSSKAELHWEDEDGNELQLTSAGKIIESALQSKSFFPSGTPMVFYQDTAPPGWTISAGVDEHSIRLTKGSSAGGQTGGTSGGTHNFSDQFANLAEGATPGVGDHVITQAELPSVNLTAQSVGSHSHTVNTASTDGGAGADVVLTSDPTARNSVHTNHSATDPAGSHGHTVPLGGSDTAHGHSVDLRVKWAACIIASKD